jgi:PAS domain S-box-containing protein
MKDHAKKNTNSSPDIEDKKTHFIESNISSDFFKVFEHHPHGYALFEIVTDTEKQISDFIPREINRAFGELIGVESEKISGSSFRDLFPDAANAQFFSAVTDIVNNRKSGHFELWSSRLSRWFDITVFSPNPPHFFATFIDISDRKQVEEKLLSSQEAFHDLVENVNDALYSVDNKGIITFVSTAIYKILGYEPNELIGKSFLQLIHSDDIGRIRLEFEEVLENILYPSEYRLLTKEGGTKWVRTSSRPMFENNNVIGVRGVLVDISERKQAEQALNQSEERYRLLFENASEVIANIDKDGKYIFLNKSAANMLGGVAADFEGKYVWEVFPVEGRTMFDNSISRVIRDGISFITERQHTIHGELRWFKTNLQPVYDSDGKIRSALIISNDIDSQKKLALYYEARLQLLQKLRRAGNIDDCLKFGCQAILQAGYFKRAVLTLHNNKREITNLGQVGLDSKTVEKARKAPAPSLELAAKITQNRFQISHSYFIPVEAGMFAEYSPRMISQNDEPLKRPNAWLPGDELFVPITNNDDTIEGWLSADTPIDGGRPGVELIKNLEELVTITAQRIHEIQNFELMLDKSRALTDSNATLRVLMAHLDEKSAEIKNQVGSQILQKLMPALDKIPRKDGTINKTYLQVLRAGLDELLNMSGGTRPVFANLSPRESEICMMIKAGSTSGEISSALDITEYTVKKHRENIRKKLGIANKKVNLWAYLNSI